MALERKKTNWTAVLFGISCLLFLLAGLFMLEGIWRAHVRSVQATVWPSVEARIRHCSLETERAFADDGGGLYYRTYCSFAYTVNGVEYISHTRTTSTVKQTMVARMEVWIGAHPRGHLQQVHYDPANPKTISLAGADEEIQTETAEVKKRSGTMLAYTALACLLMAGVLRSRQNNGAPAHADISSSSSGGV